MHKGEKMTNTDLKIMEKASIELVEKAGNFSIKTQINYDAAAGFIIGCKSLKKQIEIFFKPTIEKFKEAKKVADDGRKAEVERMEKHLQPVTDAIALVQARCKKYEDDQEVIRKEKQKKLDEAAAKKAAEDKKALEEQAEVDKAWGDNEAAEEKKEEAEAVVVETVKAKPTIAKTAGLGIRRTWQWKIINEAKIPRKYLTLDLVAINREVQAQHDETNIPGIEAFYG